MTLDKSIRTKYDDLVDRIDLDNIKHKSLAMRIKRAISWLEKAGQKTMDTDMRVIALWISFNALYGEDKYKDAKYRDSEVRESDVQADFLKKVSDLDSDRIHQAIKDNCKKQYISMMKNQYVCRQYWNKVRGRLSKISIKRSEERRVEHNLKKDWKIWRRDEGKKARGFIDEGEYEGMNQYDHLHELFERIYELRNQVIHGNATWREDINRKQVKSGCKVLDVLIPVFIDIILDNSENLTEATRRFGGKLRYPPYRFWNNDNRSHFRLTSIA